MKRRRSTFGPAYEEPIDSERIQTQQEVIRDLCLDGQWRSLGEIAHVTGYPEASISAQLRHLRKEQFGGFILDRRRREPWAGLFEYALMRPMPLQAVQLVLLEPKDPNRKETP